MDAPGRDLGNLSTSQMLFRSTLPWKVLTGLWGFLKSVLGFFSLPALMMFGILLLESLLK